MLSFRWVSKVKQLFRQGAFTTAADATQTQNPEKSPLDPKVRARKISVEKSIRYLQSDEFFKSYAGELVWKLYRRNFKGQFPPRTRKTCIRAGKISTGSPCPICRDEYLVVNYRNVELLKQFISPYSKNVLPSKTTGVCQKQHKNLLVAVRKAQDFGLLTFEVPFRFYNYDFYKKLTH